jgi:hypothetical protein
MPGTTNAVGQQQHLRIKAISELLMPFGEADLKKIG